MCDYVAPGSETSWSRAPIANEARRSTTTMGVVNLLVLLVASVAAHEKESHKNPVERVVQLIEGLKARQLFTLTQMKSFSITSDCI